LILAPDSVCRANGAGKGASHAVAQVRSAATRFNIIARQFKVSPIMAARRAKAIVLIDPDEFFAFNKSWTQERE
jgi:hypothetical protein